MKLLHDLIHDSAAARPDHTALYTGDDRVTYAALATVTRGVANGLRALGVARRDRVAIFLPKSVETVASMFGASAAGAVFVPVNPVLKAPQVGHILRDSGARVLITSAGRAASLAAELEQCRELQSLVVVDAADGAIATRAPVAWADFVGAAPAARQRGIDFDVASILYTSGSTGKPKGVVLSQRNMMAGARSVAEYLRNVETDRLLAVLPFSF